MNSKKDKLVRAFVRVDTLLKMYSKPVIYIPKDKNDKAILAIGKYWYVRYYFRHPVTHKMVEFREKQGINRFTTYKDRYAAARNLQKALIILLEDGYNPFEYYIPSSNIVEDKIINVFEALKQAFENKKKSWAANTTNINTVYFNSFRKWIEKNGLSSLPIKEFRRKHISAYLNQLNVGAISRNNHLRFLSSIFGIIASEDIIDFNIAKDIPKLKQKPTKNKPFNRKELQQIKEYLLEHDPYLRKYLQFITYGFLRPIEVNRIQIGDIDLSNRIITIQTKTEVRASVRIIETLIPVINSMDIDKYPKEAHIFSYKMVPHIWNTKAEKSRYDWFSRRFQKLKKELKFGKLYGMYSFRHSFALDLYHKFLTDGMTDLEAKRKLMTITRHKTLSGIENYLRDIGAFVPEDYSDDYTIDF